jgi:hypothetical protein
MLKFETKIEKSEYSPRLILFKEDHDLKTAGFKEDDEIVVILKSDFERIANTKESL